MEKVIYNFYNKFKVSYKDGTYEFGVYSKRDGHFVKVDLNKFEIKKLILYIIAFLFFDIKYDVKSIKKGQVICHFTKKLFIIKYEDYKIYIYSEIKGNHYYIYLSDKEFKKFAYKLIKFYITGGV